MNNSLVVCTHHPKSAVRVGSWYYTKSLAVVSDLVTCVCAPLSPFHIFFLFREDVRQRFKFLFKRNVDSSNLIKAHSFFTLSPAGPVWPFNRSFFLKSSWSLSFSKMEHSRFDIVYCDNPYLYTVVKSVQFSKLIVRIPDILPSSHSSSTFAIFEAVEWLLSRADLVIAVSEPVQKQIKEQFGKNSLVISNGVDFSRFSKLAIKPTLYEERQEKIVYVGAFDYWLDVLCILHLSQSLPDRQIILVGQASSRVRKLLKAENVIFTGALHPDQVVAYLQHADVGIIPFDVTNHKEFVDGINPLKAYEYLAAGIPVVSTDFAGARGISPYVTTAASAEEFCQAVANYLENPPDRDAVRKTAEPYDWSVVLDPFEDFVKKSLGNSDES